MKQSIPAFRFPYTLLATSIAATILSPSLSAETLKSKIDPNEVNTIVVIGEATGGLDNLISQEELEKSQASDLSEIFRHDPNVSVGGPVSMGQKIYVRDIGEDLLNISVDGAEQASGIFHHAGRVAIEPELLKHVEVEAGAGSATAGPGALGGSIRFTTKDPEDLLEDDKNIGAILKSTYSSNGGYFKKSASVFARSENNAVSGLINIVDSDQGNVDDGDNNELIGTESENKLGFAKLNIQLDEAQKLSLSYEAIEETGDIPYKPEHFVNFKNVPEPTKGERKTARLNYHFQPNNNELIDLSFNLYQTHNTQEREYSGTAYDGGIKTKGATIENTSLLGNHELIYGFNYRSDKSSFTQSDVSETGKVWGLYVQDIIDVTDRLTVTTGLRYDNYKLNDANGLSLSDNGFSPNLSANYGLTDSLSVSAGYAQAFRGPEVNDAFILDSYSNDPDLKAEKSRNIELGLNFDRENYNISAGVYHTTIKNLISGEFPWSKLKTNADDDLTTKGVFVRAQYQQDNLQLGASIKTASTKASDQVVTRYAYSSVGVSTGDTLQLNANYKVNERFNFGWNMEHVNDISNINLEFDGTELNIDKPSYTVHDIYAQWQPTANNNLKVSFSINNVFDEQYISHSSVEDFSENPGWSTISGQAETGRDARITLSYQF
jgi:hemoglobin/transferrin/lactoferrin receptor protein